MLASPIGRPALSTIRMVPDVPPTAMQRTLETPAAAFSVATAASIMRVDEHEPPHGRRIVDQTTTAARMPVITRKSRNHHRTPG
jgi:hypothetical protein